MNAHPTPIASPAVDASIRGVFTADPLRPPAPPPGAHAVELCDERGRTIAFAWVVPEYSPAALNDAAWAWLDANVPGRRASHRLRLVTGDP